MLLKFARFHQLHCFLLVLSPYPRYATKIYVSSLLTDFHDCVEIGCSCCCGIGCLIVVGYGAKAFLFFHLWVERRLKTIKSIIIYPCHCTTLCLIETNSYMMWRLLAQTPPLRFLLTLRLVLLLACCSLYFAVFNKMVFKFDFQLTFTILPCTCSLKYW